MRDTDRRGGGDERGEPPFEGGAAGVAQRGAVCTYESIIFRV